MNKTGDNMEKRIRSVKTWLDKAEQAYADDSATKGQLQLMLAQAEMQHLNEKQTPTLWQRLGFWPIALGLAVLLGGGYYVWQHQTETKPSMPSIEQQVMPDTASHTSPAASTGQTNPVAPAEGTVESNTVTTGSSSSDAAISKANANDVSTNASTQTEALQADSGSLTESAADSSAVTVQTATPNSQTNETVTAPVISTSQIQEAVREGGRSLRGQDQ